MRTATSGVVIGLYTAYSGPRTDWTRHTCCSVICLYCHPFLASVFFFFFFFCFLWECLVSLDGLHCVVVPRDLASGSMYRGVARNALVVPR